MRDDEIRERLRDRNPWWRAAATGSDVTAWVHSDQMLRARAAYDLGYRSGLLDDVAGGPLDDKLVVLRGARRVGKSVLLKDTAARLRERQDIDARQLIYVPADGMRSSDLNRLAKLGRELTRSIGEARRIWLLDEVTGVPGWTQRLKYLRDNTEMGHDTVICTGSSWDVDAELECDLLAGRAGTSNLRRSRILHPMSFRDVLLVSGRDVPLPLSVAPWMLQDHEVRGAVESLVLFVEDLDLAWQSYLTSGGFPRAVAEHQQAGAVGEAFLRDLVAWLHRDVDPDSADDSVPRLLSARQTRWQDDDSIGYIRTGAGREIDLAPTPVPSSSGTQRTVPIEAKWVAAGWRAEARVIEGKFGAGVLGTRTMLDTSRRVWALPAPVLVLLLE